MTIIAILLLAGLAIWAAVIFNGLVRLRNAARGSWSDIDVQLKRRHDLVQNLVTTVQGYVRHERQTLESVVQARQLAVGARDAGSPRQAGEAETHLGGQVRRLLAVAEAYPDLKASERFLDLQKALVQVEEDIQNARRYYNAVVRDLNSKIESFPDLVVARTAGFRQAEFFALEDAAEAVVPRVDLDSD